MAGQPGKLDEASEVLAEPGRIDVAPEMIERALNGRVVMSFRGEERRSDRLTEFFAGAATFPWRSQAAWIGRQLARRFQLDLPASDTSARKVFRSDLYRTHLRPASADLPGASEKLEGALSVPTAVSSERGRLILMADRFFDARVFDPSLPA